MSALPDDWRLTNQEGYLRGATLRWTTYVPPRPGWDHDHCEFCWAKFMAGGVPETLAAGYATPDRSHWVCPTCCADFRARFGWTVIGPAGTS